jgi:hypothetical protein
MDIAQFLKSGKTLLVDTKSAKPVAQKLDKKTKAMKQDLMMASEQDPHKRLIHEVIKEKPSKTKLVEQFQKFIDVAEAEL